MRIIVLRIGALIVLTIVPAVALALALFLWRERATPIPAVQQQIAIAGTASVGSAVVVFAAPVTCSPGDEARAPWLPQGDDREAAGTHVVSGCGTSVLTMSRPATASGASTVTFGQDRYGPSAVVATTVGATNGYFGSASSGRSTWISQLWSGSNYPSLSPLVVSTVPRGGVALTSAARMSDAEGGGLKAIITDRALAWVDANPNGWPSWARYTEGYLAPGTFGRHINDENSVASYWATVNSDPYDVNAAGRTLNTRLDCGRGSRGVENCSAALDIVNNGARYRSGIVIGASAIDDSDGRTQPAMALATGHALVWYRASAAQTWKIWSSATSGQAGLELATGRAVLSGAEFMVDGASGSTARNIGFSTSGKYRWLVSATHVGESGGNSGSDFAIGRFSDAGDYIDIPFQIIRSTGAVAISGPLRLTPSTPASSSSPCSAGEIKVDANFIYVCTAQNTFKRAALSSF